MEGSRRRVLGAIAFGGAGLAGCVTSEPSDSDDSSTAEEIHADYETTEVSVESDGETLGSVTAAIADTDDLRHTGLSDTDSLPEDRGMLFVFETADSRTFVMREMDFGLDIVYADVDGTITEIHHAEKPGPNEDGNDQEYPGFGQYVLEVSYDWTTERGIKSGDRLVFEL
jgi:uncharacterized membrane protein (UPF0127 family)